ncbi:hypothetical protein [Streptomyces sp. MJM1172]|uniref:hypothetical protein n=1 Tax=Streptomyces sp. MJM1172 TaxID=1703926 RepID=UPI0011613276
MLAGHRQVALALEELPGGREVGDPLVDLRGARLRLLVLGGWSDPEDRLAHPLPHPGELLPAEPHRLHPAPEVLALTHDFARSRAQETQVLNLSNAEAREWATSGAHAGLHEQTEALPEGTVLRYQHHRAGHRRRLGRRIPTRPGL